MSELSIILPAYNEAGNIMNAVATNAATVRELGTACEIITVNDGSTDDTGILLENLKADFPELRVVTHPVNRGLGAAIRTGLRTARGEFCILVPADSPSTADTLRPFLDAATDADVVLGYRSEKPGYSALMRFNSRVYHWAFRTLCGLPYRDINWIHLYRRSIFDVIDLKFEGIVMQAEIVLKAHLLGLRIKEVPCAMQERRHGRASASKLKVMVRTGLDLFRLLWLWARGKMGRAGMGGLLADEKSGCGEGRT